MLTMVNRYKLELTNLQKKIMRLLFKKNGKELNQNQIAKYLKVSQTAVMKALPDLKEKELIEINQDKETRRWSILLNKDNSFVFQLKRVDNLKQIYEYGFFDFVEKEFAGATIILFGSYSRGEDTINSDIDIAVIGRKEKSINLGKFDEIFERKIIFNFYDSFNVIHKNLRENLFNGIVLAGGIEL
jgi:predicted nucleotidyltransferase/biotin operon repressor